MNRRSFLKAALFGLGALAIPSTLIPKREPNYEPWYAPAGLQRGKILEPITVEYKGRTVFDAGYVYCPYIPLTIMRAR